MRISDPNNSHPVLGMLLSDIPGAWSSASPSITLRLFEPLEFYSREGVPGTRSWSEAAAYRGSTITPDLDWRDLSENQRLYLPDGLIEGPQDGVLSRSITKIFADAIQTVHQVSGTATAAVWCGYAAIRRLRSAPMHGLVDLDRQVVEAIESGKLLRVDHEDYALFEDRAEEITGQGWRFPDDSYLADLCPQAITFEHLACGLSAELDGTFTYAFGPADLIGSTRFQAYLVALGVETVYI